MNKNIVCVGEILWDIIGQQKHIGGAPFNTAAHLAALGFEAYPVSTLGRDELGAGALDELKRLGVRDDMVAFSDCPTGYARVFSKADGTPDFELPLGVAYDQTRITPELSKRIKELAPRAVIYGSLALKRSDALKNDLFTLISELEETVGFFDVNLRKDFFDGELLKEGISLCRIVKFNDGELGVISRAVYGRELGFREFAERVFSESGCQAVVQTCGEKGALAFGRDGKYAESGAIAVEVADTVGAGDAFNAGFLCRYISGADLSACLAAGNRMGAYVASKKGAVPPLEEALVKEVLGC